MQLIFEGSGFIRFILYWTNKDNSLTIQIQKLLTYSYQLIMD